MNIYMQSMDPIDVREADIAKIAESKEDVATLRKHLKEIIEGTAFKGSHRSSQFLSFIVDQAIAGNFDSLKERVIGIELFGRTPSYDTGEDAIVRVTASDVRKRLLQHYGTYGAPPEFRVSLPLGSYVPEITRDRHFGQLDLVHPIGVREELEAAPNDPATAHSGPETPPPQAALAFAPAVLHPETAYPASQSRRGWLSFAVLIVALNLALWGIFWSRSSPQKAVSAPEPLWSAFFRPLHATHLITSDPNIAEIQGFTGGQISVSDYANHSYIPDSKKLTAEEIQFCKAILRGDKAAAVDTPIAVHIAELAQTNSQRIDVRASRSFELSDLKNDDNFIFLGSPRSDPWSALFNDQLDFRFLFDTTTGQEIIQNVRPQPHELPQYVPTAMGWATGQSYAIVALVQNPDQNGHVLLLGGANGEGTEAAGKLATDLPRLSQALQKCGIQPLGALQHFELLLRLSTMAGTPSNVDLVACHILPGSSGQKP